MSAGGGWNPLVVSLAVCMVVTASRPCAAQPPAGAGLPRSQSVSPRAGPPAAGAAGAAGSLRDSPFAFLMSDGASSMSPARRRLASTPPMFGDAYPRHSLTFQGLDGLITADVALAGASGRVKVADHNEAFPVDRVFCHYHHFDEALQWERRLMPGGPVVQTASSAIDQYTFGFEKTFGGGDWSLELRMPFTGGEQLSGFGFQFTDGNVGSLAAIAKRLIWRDDVGALVAGLAVDVPTGEDVRGQLPAGVDFVWCQDATCLSPYLGALAAPGDAFFHAFVQFNVPLGGNRVDVRDLGAGTSQSASLDERLHFYLDISAGYWLQREPGAPLLTGVAALVELHFTTASENSDAVTFFAGLPQFGNAARRLDVANATVGLHLELADLTQLRIGGAWPLLTDEDRLFDGELNIAVIRRF